METLTKPVARIHDLVVQKLETETLIYDLKANRAYCLNESSALVWGLCDGRRTVSDISDEISKRLKTLVNEDFIWLALDQFQKDGLLDSESTLDGHFAGLSRREVIRRVGFASVVALPIVSSLIAPKASMAQSCIAINAPCLLANPTACCSNNCIQLGNPASCCAPGVTVNRFAGETQGCQPIAGASQANCDGGAAGGCCTGTGTLAGGPGTNGCPATTVACVCD